MDFIAVSPPEKSDGFFRLAHRRLLDVSWLLCLCFCAGMANFIPLLLVGSDLLCLCFILGQLSFGKGMKMKRRNAKESCGSGM